MELVVATIKNWNINNFHKIKDDNHWTLIQCKDDLTLHNIENINPRYIFFPHWSWKIPKEIYENFECVVFHPTDLPYGRGGSPIQNLIVRGHTSTWVSAIKANEIIDGGPVYMKQFLLLSGNAEEIYLRYSDIIFEMIKDIAYGNPEPIKQIGTPVVFPRRTPLESAIPENSTLNKVHDWIRMLDAEGYPHAFIETDSYRVEFTRASLKDGHIMADARITLK